MSKGNDPTVYFQDPDVVALCKAVMSGDIKAIDRLVAEGADVNFVGKDGMTPLLYSIAGANKAGLQRLLEHGADPNLQMDNKDSFMLYAARGRDTDYLKLGLAHGGDPNLRGRMNRTLLFEAAMENNESMKESLSLLLGHGADINAIDISQETAAMAAAGINQYESSLYLLEQGSDYTQENRWGNSIRYYLEDNRIGYSPGLLGYDDRTRVAQFLIDRGIEVRLKEPYKAPKDWLEKSFEAIGKPMPPYLR